MATILPWTSVEIGDLDIATPAMPCLLVHTSYIDGEPESSVTFFWQDEETGLVNHEVLFLKPVPFDEALAWAEDHAAANEVRRIHVKRAKPAPARTRMRKKLRAGTRNKSEKRKLPRRKAGVRRKAAWRSAGR